METQQSSLPTLPPSTDSQNGERIAALFGDDLRHCVELRQWFIWDGRRWKIDEAGEILRFAAEAMRNLYDAQPGARRYARVYDSLPRLRAAIHMAATKDSLRVNLGALDRDPLLLNCENGILDLRTGALLPHDRAQLMTKICSVTYGADSPCPVFLTALHQAMGSDDRVEFLQRVFGYALTGMVRERTAFVFLGRRGNEGKTTLLRAFARAMGEYAARMPPAVLSARGADSAAVLAYFAELHGARFVSADDVDQPIKRSTLEYATGSSGYVQGKRKYSPLIEFPPSHKIFLATNRRPRVRGGGTLCGFLTPVSFEVSRAYEECDRSLPEKLFLERAGILSWALQGCLQWQAAGLGGIPGEVAPNPGSSAATFLRDRCVSEAGAWVPSRELYEEYKSFCRGIGATKAVPTTRNYFAGLMREEGYCISRSRRRGGRQLRTWEGVRSRFSRP